MAPAQKDTGGSKCKMRTSEDVYNRLRWDEDLSAAEVIVGYEDRLEGPMEMPLAAFVPLNDGGNIPFHRIWYFRRGPEVLWDRRRRLDRIFGSGDTAAIKAGRRTPNFDPAADAAAAEQTEAAIDQAQKTLARLEEERAELLDRRRHEKLRKVGRLLEQGQLLDDVKVIVGEAATDSHADQLGPAAEGGSRGAARAPIRIATWNVLSDEHGAHPGPPASERAAGLAAAALAVAPDILALQEAGPEVREALLAVWPRPHWYAEGPHGMALLSRLPLVHAGCLRFSLSKSALLAEIAVQGRMLGVANLHLTSDRKGDELVDNSSTRGIQAMQARAALTQYLPHADHLVLGDFNEPSVGGEVGQAAGSCMAGLIDVWPAVHGTADPGHTFDPVRNPLADLQALNKLSRRLDRIFASPMWRPEAASLFGTDLQEPVSDHFGVVATLELQPPLLAPPTKRTAAAVLPPQALWPQIDEVRRRFDPSYGRWMPHINLFFGFLPEQHLGEAAAAVQPILRRLGPFEVRLARLTVFEHARTASLVVLPDCEPPGALEELRVELEVLFPGCAESTLHKFQPHLTLGHFETVEQARRCLSDLLADWQPCTFVADSVTFLARDDDGEPFKKVASEPLGWRLADADESILQLLEAQTGARAFAVGSAAILGSLRPPSSDLDVLLVGPKPCGDVYEALEALPAAWRRRVEDAQFPIMQLEVADGTRVDVQYAQCSIRQHPVHWPGDTAAAHNAHALRDAHVLRATLLEKYSLAGWRTFQEALLALKRWTELRGISGSALGYPSSFSWMILLANTMLAGCSGDTDDLLKSMLQRFASWPWPKPVALVDDIEGADAACPGVMPILCPTEPHADSARNVTAETLALLRHELRLAADGAAIGHLLATYPVFVRLEVHDALPQCAELEARLLMLVRDLQGYAVRPLKLGAGRFLVGVAVADADGAPQQDEGRAGVAARDAVGHFLRVACRAEWSARLSATVEGSEATRAWWSEELERTPAAGNGQQATSSQ